MFVSCSIFALHHNGNTGHTSSSLADCCSGTGFPPPRLEDRIKKKDFFFLKKISINCRSFESVCSFRCFKMHFSLCLCVSLQSTRALIMTIKSLITPRPHLSSAGAISCAPPPRCATSGLIGNHGADGESGQKKKRLDSKGGSVQMETRA